MRELKNEHPSDAPSVQQPNESNLTTEQMSENAITHSHQSKHTQAKAVPDETLEQSYENTTVIIRKRQYTQAIPLLKLAAEQGHLDAKLALTYCYYQLALTWGNTASQTNDDNERKSGVYLAIAAKQGHHAATSVNFSNNKTSWDATFEDTWQSLKLLFLGLLDEGSTINEISLKGNDADKFNKDAVFCIFKTSFLLGIYTPKVFFDRAMRHLEQGQQRIAYSKLKTALKFKFSFDSKPTKTVAIQTMVTWLNQFIVTTSTKRIDDQDTLIHQLYQWKPDELENLDWQACFSTVRQNYPLITTRALNQIKSACLDHLYNRKIVINRGLLSLQYESKESSFELATAHLFIQLAYTPKTIVHQLVRALILSLDSSQKAKRLQTKKAKSDLIYLHKKFPSYVIRGLNRAIQDREKRDFSLPNRLEAISLLIKFGKERPAWIQKLLDLINDKRLDRSYKRIALKALGFMKEPTTPVIETLATQFIRDGSKIEEKALFRLSKTSPKLVIQVLNKALTEAENLRHLLKNASKPVLDNLSDSSEIIGELTYTCFAMQQLLIKLGQNSPKLIDFLIERLINYTWENGDEIAEALKQLQNPTHQQIQSLIRLLNPSALPNSLLDASEVYKLIIQILDTLGMKYPQVIDEVTKLLSSADPDLRSKGAVILGRVQKMTPQIEPIIIETIAHSEQYIRQAATGILIGVENPSKKLIDDMIYTLNHYDAKICFDIAVRLGEIENASQDMAKGFTRLLKRDDVDLRLVAIEALRKTQQPTFEMFKILVDIALYDAMAEARNEALETLIVFNKQYPKLIDLQIQPTIHAAQIDINKFKTTSHPPSGQDLKSFYRKMEILIHLNKASPDLIEWLLYSIRNVHPNADSVITSLLNQKIFFSTKTKSILIETLTHNLKSPNRTTLYLSAGGLIILGCVSQNVLQALHTGMEKHYNDSEEAQTYFITTLKKSPHIIEALTPYLMNALKHENNLVRFVAARDLISFDKNPAELVNTLIDLFREFFAGKSKPASGVESILKWIAEKLIHLGKCLPEHLKILLYILEHGDSEDLPEVTNTLEKLLSPTALCNTLNDILHSNKNTHGSPSNALFEKIENNKKRPRENDKKNAEPETKRHKTEQTAPTTTATNATQTMRR